VLTELSPPRDLLYSHMGRPSIAPETRLRARLLQVLYTVRRERLLMEPLDYHLLCRWLVGLHRDDPVWDASTFRKNRERLLEGDVARAFFDRVLAQARERTLWSDEPFTGDGTLVDAWAGQKRCKRNAGETPTGRPDDPGNPTVDFRGARRTNAPHASTTDPEARLYKKATGQEAKRCSLGHALMANRHGVVVDTCVTQGSGTAEREAALAMGEAMPGQHRITLGGDKHDGTRDCARELRGLRATPHVAPHTTGRASVIDGRTTRHPGYAISQQRRKRVEEIFGWRNTGGRLRQTRHRGAARVGWMFMVAAAVYHLVRMRTLVAVARAQRRPGMQAPFRTWLRLPTPGAQRPVIRQRSCHTAPSILGSITVQLLDGVFQQPARGSHASRLRLLRVGGRLG